MIDIKFTVLGAMIYTTMQIYLLAFVAYTSRARRLGVAMYAIAFAIAAAAVVYRAWEAGHAPMSNMFEVFLMLGAMVFPLSLFCRRFLRTGGMAGDMLIGFLLLVPPAFFISDVVVPLPQILQSRLFIPHVTAYMLAYVIMGKAGFLSLAQLVRGNRPSAPGLLERETAAYRLVCLGFPLLTAGLVLGACWGKQAWGDWWNWDPKELWSLATWSFFLFYLHFRGMFGRRLARINALFILVGVAIIIITLSWVNLSSLFSGLHSYA